MAQLLSSFEKRGVRLGLDTLKANIEDTTYLSKYFSIVEYNPTFTAGKNLFSFNGSSLLAKGSEIKVECLDSHGNPLYIEFYKSTIQNTDVAKFVISINVYDENYNGPGKLFLVGTTPTGEVVRWTGNIAIDKTINNVSQVRFYDNPTLEVRPLLYPVADVSKAQIDPDIPIAKTAQLSATITFGIGSINITNGGAGYVHLPTVTISGNATATANVNGGKVVSITVTNNGSGYNTLVQPTITFTPTGGDTITTPASATAVFSGRVATLHIDNGGGGYDSSNPPLVTFTPIGTGQGASATSIVNGVGVISGLTLTNSGSDYKANPIVSVPAPPSQNTILTVTANYNESFYGYAVTPPKDSNKNALDKKRIDVDYRIVTPYISDEFADPILVQTGSFNTQMEGKMITLYVKKIALPNTNQELKTSITQSAIIKKVLNSKTVTIEDPFYYQNGKNYLITNILEGTCNVDYEYTKYNVNPEAIRKTTPFDGSTPQAVLQSYAEITYRNLRPFAGYVARHKLYRKSLTNPGDYKLVSDEPLSTIELLTDIITINKAYDKMGSFYNQKVIDKYWYPSSGLALSAKTDPINSMYIDGGNPSNVNGAAYVIAKTDSVKVNDSDPPIINDDVYYPYDKESFNNLSGVSYNSNFIPLKKNVLYILSANVSMDKALNDSANLEFYFTSSISSISQEKTYNPTFGMKLGEISTSDKVTTKVFDGKQYIYFTPANDYYGTLVIVPTKCNVKLSELSLKIYGDYAFSPDILFIRIPFPINVQNESFELKAELFDINSNIIYSNLKAVQIFDQDGISDIVAGTSITSDYQEAFHVAASSAAASSAASSVEITTNPNSIISLPGNIIIQELIPTQDKPQRFVGWFTPSDDPSTSGKLCYTNVTKLFIDDNDYISLSTTDGVTETTVTSLAVRYYGRRIFVDTAGNKYHYP